MKTTLVLTVGGSHQPILTSIEQHQPAKVYFLCSADSGKLKGSYHQVIGEGKVLKSRPELDKPDLPNIATLAKLPPEKVHVHQIGQFDDLNACYLEALQMIEKARAEFPDANVLVDYTGGTKSMTAGLTAAALDDGQCDICLVAGRRPDLVKVQDQTEFVRPMRVWDAQATRRLRAARELLVRFDYAAAENLLRAAAARFASERTVQTLQRGIALCRAFDAWDKFDHGSARRLLEPYRGEFVAHWRFLIGLTEEGKGHGFEWVEDLLQNAERRAAQGRYDDAVGRLYRALELTAQVWLRRKHGIDTSDVQLGAVPESQRTALEHYRGEDGEGEAGKIKIGLLRAWDLLAALPGDPLGGRFLPRRNAILNFLTKRNQSLFAHGVRPVSPQDYTDSAPDQCAFLEDCIGAAAQAVNRQRTVVLEQLPTDFLNAVL
jgi:hypothetical protein